jgi:D-lactate dehydrogenase
MVTIAFFEIEPWEEDYLRDKMKQVERKFVNPIELRFTKERLTLENADQYRDCDMVSVFIFSTLTKEVIARLSKLKHINTESTGYDHIDLGECQKRGVSVSYVPSYGENTVAEHAFALLLALSRRIIDSVEHTRRGRFDTGPELRGFDLRGLTIGVIGTGRIGMHAIRMAKGFEMNVIASDAFPNEKAAQDMGFRYVPLDELLARSDVITLHAPLLPSTKHMINLQNITKVKKGVVIINTARGGLIDTDALLWGLESGYIKALGLDVLEEENTIKEEKQLLSKHFDTQAMRTLLEEHMLLEYDNVIMTPHNAFNSAEALKRILDTSVDNLDGALGQKPVNLVKMQ